MQAKNNREDVCDCEYMSVETKSTYSLSSLQSGGKTLSLGSESWVQRRRFMSLLSYSVKSTYDFTCLIHTKASKWGL